MHRIMHASWASLPSDIFSSCDGIICKLGVQVPCSLQLDRCLLQGYGIINLFLLSNLVTTTSTLPVLLGLLEGPVIQRIITPLSALFGCFFSFVSLIVWAYCMAPSWGLSFNDVSGHALFLMHGMQQLGLSISTWEIRSLTDLLVACMHAKLIIF